MSSPTFDALGSCAPTSFAATCCTPAPGRLVTPHPAARPRLRLAPFAAAAAAWGAARLRPRLLAAFIGVVSAGILLVGWLFNAVL